MLKTYICIHYSQKHTFVYVSEFHNKIKRLQFAFTKKHRVSRQ